MICTCARIKAFSKWWVYILSALASDRNLVLGHSRNTKKNTCAENMTKRDYKYSSLKVSTEAMEIIVWKCHTKKAILET